MQLKDFGIAENATGIYHQAGNFFIDPQHVSEVAVVTHAHADHAIKGNKLVYCTQPTKDLMLARYGKYAAGNFVVKNFIEPFVINNVELCFYPAGHILGSASVLIKYNGKSVFITGDIKLQKDSTCEEVVLPEADLLITESTFANPETKHPDVIDQIKNLKNYTDKNIVIGVYAIGKAQRLTRLINDYCPEFTIMVHPSIIPYHHVYEKAGFLSGKWIPYKRQDFKKNTGIIYLTVPLAVEAFFRNTDVYAAFASGWQHLQKKATVSLSISDHADWDDLLAIINQVNPLFIKTVHGNGDLLKNHLAVSKNNIEFIV
ncbi:MAG TPA: exonuclease [Bacteroidia bacterium]|nr:exonuclease [Bacteroidia bacterium]HNU33877.1 exonuclease [Bacteroidia bacterium]